MYQKTNQFIFISGNNWNIDFLGARENTLMFFTPEDIDASKMSLGTSVLAGHGCRQFDDFAGTVVQHYMASRSQGRAGHFESQRLASH